MLVRYVRRAYPFLRTERTHGLSSRICKHQFSDWTSLQVKCCFPITNNQESVVMSKFNMSCDVAAVVT